MKDWHKLVLVYIAGRKTPATPENIKQYLKKHGISKSHTAITTACKELLSDVLVRHDHSTYNDDDTVKLKRFKYSLKDGFLTLHLIVKSLKHPYTQQTFMKSEYWRSRIPELVDALNRSFAEVGLTRIDIEHVGDDPNFVKNLKRTYASMDFVKRDIKAVESDIKAVESGKYDKELIKDGRTKKDVVAGFKKYLIELERRAELESYDPDPPYTFSNSELKDITKALEYNWTMLRFIVHYLDADNETKRKLMITLAADASRIPPTAVKVDTIGRMIHIIKKFIMDNNLQISGTIPDEYLFEGIDSNTEDGMIRGINTKAKKQLLGPDDLQTVRFAEFFDILFVIRDRYPFAFD